MLSVCLAHLTALCHSRYSLSQSDCCVDDIPCADYVAVYCIVQKHGSTTRGMKPVQLTGEVISPARSFH